MNGSVVRQLILKDLYLVRWLIVGAIVAGIPALALMPASGLTSYVGGVSLICVLIILNIFLVMSGVVQERKDKVLLFALSLPVSSAQYTAAKVIGNAIAFLVPWIILTVAAIVVIDATRMPNGILPFWITVLVSLLLYYCILLAVGLVWDATAAHVSMITAGNVSVNFLIAFLLGLPSVRTNAESQTAVWTADIITILGIELAAAVVILGTAVYVRSRRGDYV